jgi:cbb3-type cytochrome oxidase maturation protein
VEVLTLTLFVSLFLAGLGVGFFIWGVRAGTGEHADRLALLPLEPEQQRPEDAARAPTSSNP